MRLDKVVHRLNEFCVRNKQKERLIPYKDKIVLCASEPRLWEILIFLAPFIACWIGYIVDELKETIGLVSLAALTIYLIWTYFEVAKAINKISINLETGEIKIINLDKVYRRFFKPVRFKIDIKDKVLKKRKRFSLHGENFRIYVETDLGVVTLIDIEGDYASDKFNFALNYIMTTKHVTEPTINRRFNG